MKAAMAVLTTVLILTPLSCDRPVTEPDLARIAADQKIKVKDGITKGVAPQIVAVTGPVGNQRMMLWTLNSAGATDITPPCFTSAAPGDWSPDGSQLVFFGDVQTPCPGLGMGRDVYTMGIDVYGTPDFSSIRHVSWSNPHPDEAPAWSPDGTMIGWLCHQPPKVPSTRSNTAICYAVKDAGGGWGPTHVLSSDPGSAVTTFYHDGPPSWSPGSDKLLFSRIPAGCTEQEPPGFPPFIPGGFPFSSCPTNHTADLFTVDLASTETMLTNTADLEEEDPAWEPKSGSTLIAYAIHYDDDEIDIFSGHLAAMSVRYAVTSMAGAERFPWWVPGGKQITYVQGPNNDTDVYIVDLGGTNNTNLTNSPGILDFFARVRPVITP